jgi:hypothetical protein
MAAIAPNYTNDHFDVSGRINPSEEEIRRKIL